MNPIDKIKIMDAIAFVVLTSDILLDLAGLPEVDILWAPKNTGQLM